MNDVQRKNIFAYRLDGLGYGAIAKITGISIDGVKAFCKRNHLDGPKEAVILNVQFMTEQKVICACCKKKIRQRKRGRRRRFCSDKCRWKWWNDMRSKHL